MGSAVGSVPSLPVLATAAASSKPLLVPEPGVGEVSAVQITRLLTPERRLGLVLAHHRDDQRLDVATVVVGDATPIGMTDDGTLTSLFGQPARRFIPVDSATADRLCSPAAVVLPERGVTLWANDPVEVLTAIGDVFRVDGDTITVGNLPAGDELITPTSLSSGGVLLEYAVGTTFHVSMSSLSATVPAGCGPWTAVQIGDRTGWASPPGPPQPIGVSPASVSWQAGEWSSVTVSGTGSLNDIIAMARSLTFVTIDEFAVRHDVTTPTG